MYYLHKDHLGSITQITDKNRDLVQAYYYNAWGVREITEDPLNLEEYFLDRGYTGHEHLALFGIINMNGRVYDPIVGRFLSPDNHIQAPGYSQSFNRYSYAFNNPFKYTDPSGEIVAFTETGYEFWKYISPVAFKVDIHLLGPQKGIGFNVSVGSPKIIPVAQRFHYGKTYYWSYYDNAYTGWETRRGEEITIAWFYTVSGTEFSWSGEEGSQTLSQITLGGPLINFKYENDHLHETKFKYSRQVADYFGIPMADGGDRWRSASFRLKVGPFSVGSNVFTGDPGYDLDYRYKNTKPGTRLHEGKRVFTGGTINKYRAGTLYFGIGPVKIGRNSEQIRHVLQNKFAHDPLEIPNVEVLDIDATWYFYFGTGTGNSLW